MKRIARLAVIQTDADSINFIQIFELLLLNFRILSLLNAPCAIPPQPPLNCVLFFHFYLYVQYKCETSILYCNIIQPHLPKAYTPLPPHPPPSRTHHTNTIQNQGVCPQNIVTKCPNAIFIKSFPYLLRLSPLRFRSLFPVLIRTSIYVYVFACIVYIMTGAV